MQPTTSPSPAPATPSAPQAPSANITRSDSVVGGNAPAATGASTGTLQPSGTERVAPAQQQSPGLSMLLIPVMIVGFGIMMYLSSRADKKKRAEHTATLAGLQRNDKVETIGGMLGTVAEINDNEVIIKTDEITNTRIRVRRSAIATILNRSSKPDGLKIEPVKTSA